MVKRKSSYYGQILITDTKVKLRTTEDSPLANGVLVSFDPSDITSTKGLNLIFEEAIASIERRKNADSD